MIFGIALTGWFCWLILQSKVSVVAWIMFWPVLFPVEVLTRAVNWRYVVDNLGGIFFALIVGGIVAEGIRGLVTDRKPER